MRPGFASAWLVTVFIACAGLPAWAGTGDLLAAARAAAQADRNAEAARLFAGVVAAGGASPGVLAEYADQLTYSGQARLAVPLYRQAIAGLPDGERPRAERGLALALLWSGANGQAVVAWQKVVAGAPDDADARQNLSRALVGAARDAAGQDRNRAAADLFARAIALEPQRRAEVLGEYADQLTYSDRSAAAVPLYRELLARSRDDAGRAAVQLRLALALSWSGRLVEAEASYRSVLRFDPANAEARLGVARVLGWQDENRASAMQYRAILADDPANRQAVLGAAEQESYIGQPRRSAVRLRPVTGGVSDRQTLLVAARAELWAGRPDLARPLALRMLRMDAKDSEALALLDEIAAGNAPKTSVRAVATQEGDGQAGRGGEVEHSQRFNGGLTRLGVRAGQRSYATDSDTVLRRASVDLFGSQRLGDGFEVNGSLGWDGLRGQAGSAGGLRYDLWLTYWPDDFWRFDLSLGRDRFDDVQSLVGGVYEDRYGVSVDFRPDQRWRLTGRAAISRVSDGNTRRFAQVEAEMQPDPKKDFFLGGRASWLDFSRPDLATGYFNPDWKRAVDLTARGSFALPSAWQAEVWGSAGYEWLPDGAKPAWSARAALARDLTDRARLRIEVGTLGTGQGAGGFRRTTLSVGIDYAW